MFIFLRRYMKKTSWMDSFKASLTFFTLANSLIFASCNTKSHQVSYLQTSANSKEIFK